MRATLAQIGTIIGAGVFAVPAMIGAWGIIPGTLGFMAVALIVLSVHLYLTEAALAYRPQARLTGFARHWLGPNAAAIGGVSLTLQIYGGALAYLILGGQFLAVLAHQVGIDLPLSVWQLLFWAVVACVVALKLNQLSRVAAFVTWLMVTTMLLIIGSLIGRIHPELVTVLPQHFTFEPYGVFLFALMGLNVIPELETIVAGKAGDMRLAVTRGTLGAAFLIYTFGVTVWLASGGVLGRSPTDVIALLPPALAFIVPLFGFLAVTTPFVTTMFDLRSMFHFDYHMRSWLAWIAALGIPLLLLLLTTHDFLAIIGFVGSIFDATTATVAVLAGRAALRAAGIAPLGSRGWLVQELIPALVIAALVFGGTLWLVIR
jgi:amino acid permease